MDLLDRIKSDLLAARKAKNTGLIGLLNPLVSDISLVGKNDGNREPTDADAIAVIKKFLKGAQENVQACSKAGRDATIAILEVAVLGNYLPKRMSEAELRQVVNVYVKSTSEPTVGMVMRMLKEKYNGQYDGKMASVLVSEEISNTSEWRIGELTRIAKKAN